MSSKPLIGINTDFRPSAKDAPAFSFVASTYADHIRAAGGIPVLLSPLDNDDDVAQVLNGLDGVVFVGGADLDPRRDGFMLHPSVRLLDPRREDFDRMLAAQVVRRRMPVLAIGVGMQLLNVAAGGNLFLHISEDLPKSIPHKDPLDPNHRHALCVVPGTLMERVFGEGEVRVNSMHHMAVDLVAPGFEVTARAPDGVVEAIESTEPDWVAIGTQFHPEAASASALDQRIFEEFVAGIRGEVLVDVLDDLRIAA